MILAIVLVFSAIGWGITSLFLSNDEINADTLNENLQLSIEKLGEQLTPDNQLYLKIETFRRYGPASERIMKRPFANPERYFEEVWMQIDSERNVSNYTTATTDQNGKLIQTGEVVGEEVVFTDINSGETNSVPFRKSNIDAYFQGSLNIIDRLEKEKWDSIGRGQINNVKTAIFQRLQQIDNSLSSPLESDDIVIPWTQDLNPFKMEMQAEIGIDNPFIFSVKRWIIDEGGNKTLVEENKTIAFAVINK
jgi:hypothetical protein